MIRTSTDRSCLGSIIHFYKATAAVHALGVVVGTGGLGEGSDIVAGGFENEHEKRHERDKDKVYWVAGPGRGPSGHVVRAASTPHEVAGTEGLVGYSFASRGVEGGGLNPACG